MLEWSLLSPWTHIPSLNHPSSSKRRPSKSAALRPTELVMVQSAATLCVCPPSAPSTILSWRRPAHRARLYNSPKPSPKPTRTRIPPAPTMRSRQGCRHVHTARIWLLQAKCIMFTTHPRPATLQTGGFRRTTSVLSSGVSLHLHRIHNMYMSSAHTCHQCVPTASRLRSLPHTRRPAASRFAQAAASSPSRPRSCASLSHKATAHLKPGLSHCATGGSASIPFHS